MNDGMFDFLLGCMFAFFIFPFVVRCFLAFGLNISWPAFLFFEINWSPGLGLGLGLGPGPGSGPPWHMASMWRTYNTSLLSIMCESSSRSSRGSSNINRNNNNLQHKQAATTNSNNIQQKSWNCSEYFFYFLTKYANYLSRIWLYFRI